MSLWSVSNARDVSVVLKYVDESNLKFLVARGGFKKKKLILGAEQASYPLALFCVCEIQRKD